MEIATVSSKYQIVIPQQIRSSLNISPGQKLMMFPYLNRIEIVILRSILDLAGTLPDLNTDLGRDEEDRL